MDVLFIFSLYATPFHEGESLVCLSTVLRVAVLRMDESSS